MIHLILSVALAAFITLFVKAEYHVHECKVENTKLLMRTKKLMDKLDND